MLRLGVFGAQQTVQRVAHVVARGVYLGLVHGEQPKQQVGGFAQAHAHPLAGLVMVLHEVGHDDVASLLQGLAQRVHVVLHRRIVVRVD